MSGVARKLLGGVLAISLFMCSSLSAFAVYSISDVKSESFTYRSGDKYLPISFPYFNSGLFNNVTVDGFDSPLFIDYYVRNTVSSDDPSIRYDYVNFNLPYSGYYTGLDIFSDSLVFTDHLNFQLVSYDESLVAYFEQTNLSDGSYSFDSSVLTVDLIEFSPSYINYNFSIKSSSSVIPSFDANIYIGNDYSNISGNSYTVNSDLINHLVTQSPDGLFVHNFSFSLFVEEIGSASDIVRHNIDLMFPSQFEFKEISLDLSSVSHPGLIQQGTIQSTMTSLFDRLIAWINGIRNSQNDDYITVTDPSTSQEIQETQQMIDTVESFENTLSADISTQFDQIDFTTPTNLAAPVAFIGDKVTRSLNSLGNYQPLIFVPLTLGIMLIMLGRGVSALGAVGSSASRFRTDGLDGIRSNPRDERWLY